MQAIHIWVGQLLYTCVLPVSDAERSWSATLQARDRKLRIFPDEDHPFKDHPQLVKWEMPPRKIRWARTNSRSD